MKRYGLIAILMIAFLSANLAFGVNMTDNYVFEGPVTFKNTINQSGSNMTVTPSATGYLNVTTGNLKVGNGTPTTTLNGEDAYIEGTVEVDGVARFDATTMILRGVTYTIPSADGAASSFLSTDGSGTLSWSAGSGSTLDTAYDTGGAGAGRTITADTGAVTITNTDADTAYLLSITPTPGSSAALGGVQVTSGANSTQDSLNIVNSGSGDDIEAGNGAFKVSSTGAVTSVGITNAGAAVSLNASSNFATNVNTGTSSGSVTIGGGSNTVAVNSTTWDVSTTGAGSFVGISSSDDITLANGKAVKSSTTTAETVKIQGYDVDNTTYRDVLAITNGNTIGAVLGSGNEIFSVNSADWDIGTTGDMTGIGAVTMDGVLTYNNAAMTLYANEALTVTHAANGAADDLTITQTGAFDASLLLSSAGTGADAIGLAAAAGTVKISGDILDIDSTGDLNITVTSSAGAEDILISQVGANDSSITLTAAGTGTDAIGLNATAGGVDIDAAAAQDVNIAGGQVALVSKDDAASAISLTANIGTSETIVVTNTLGTSESAITLLSSAGGVNIDAAAAKDVDIAGGQVLISSKTAGASAIALTSNQGASDTIVVTNTQGTGAAAVALTATAGGTTITSASDLLIASRISNTPLTYSFTTEGNITSPLTSSIVLLDGDNDAENDTIDLQNGTTAGQIAVLIAAVDIDSDDTCTINYGDTTCTNCPATAFDKVGESATLIWTGTTWVVLSLNSSL
jgi:hypothetical protein